jgi:quinol-cytochrome oxidoreductase complex cytochrome b subunit
MKRVNITSLILVIYVIVMAVIGWPGNDPEKGYTEYIIIILVSLGIIGLLRYVQIKRFKNREEMKKEKNKE